MRVLSGNSRKVVCKSIANGQVCATLGACGAVIVHPRVLTSSSVLLVSVLEASNKEFFRRWCECKVY